jgi:hypothetical protein
VFELSETWGCERREEVEGRVGYGRVREEGVQRGCEEGDKCCDVVLAGEGMKG